MLDVRENEAREGVPGTQTPIKVLIVDDHAILRAGVREMLSEEQDLEVVGEAGSAEEALQQLRDGLAVDIVVLDITLPGQSGIDLVENIVNRSSNVGGWVGAVNATNWSTGSGTYNITSLPSMRTVYDLSNLDNSVNHHTTGQSGHPYSEHYADQIPLWSSLTYKHMGFSREVVEASAVSTLTLQPQ